MFCFPSSKIICLTQKLNISTLSYQHEQTFFHSATWVFLKNGDKQLPVYY